MAYAAVVSLEQTIKRFTNSPDISIAQNFSPQIIQLLHIEVRSLREALEEFNTRRSTINMIRVKTLEGEIIEAVWEFEDVIELHVSDQFLSQSESHPLFSLDLQELKQDIYSFIETVSKMKKTYSRELWNPSPGEEDNHVVPSRIDFGGSESNMVGLSDEFMTLKNMFGKYFSRSKLRIFSLVGMAGIGKSTLAKKLFQEPSVVNCYNRRAFVIIGPRYQLVDVLVDILLQVNPDIDEIMLMREEELLVGLKWKVYESLKYLRYWIVLDDVWYREIWGELDNIFPNDNNGSLVLLTTRLQQVAETASPWSKYHLRFLDKKESWDLFRQKVFGEESCSYGLEKAGKKIAENCEGLPLTILTVSDIMSKSEKKTEYWNEVADQKQHSVYKNAYDQMSKVLYPSYDYLPQHLKACFLYIGAFPLDNGVPLIQLVFEPLRCFDHISHLHELRTLYIIIVNPIFKNAVVAPLAPLSDAPSSLTTLTLRGSCYPWEEMIKISSLPNLSELTITEVFNNFDEPEDFVCSSNMYIEAGRWGDVISRRGFMFVWKSEDILMMFVRMISDYVDDILIICWRDLCKTERSGSGEPFYMDKGLPIIGH